MSACTDWSSRYLAGSVKCNDDCTIDFSACNETPICGDMRLQDGEVCDGNAFIIDTQCSYWDIKYNVGNVRCNSDCTINYNSCRTETPAYCGNGILDEDEECDGSKFLYNMRSCSQWTDRFTDGNVGCTEYCTIDMEPCYEQPQVSEEICDNGEDDNRNGLRDCDDPDCFTHASCLPQSACGNGILDVDELCDGYAFATTIECSAWNPIYKKGTISCKDDCTPDYSNCSIRQDEICDNQIDDDLDGKMDCEDIDCQAAEACKESQDLEYDHTIAHVPEHPDCSQSPQQAPRQAPAVFMLGILGLCAAMRRRRAK